MAKGNPYDSQYSTIRLYWTRIASKRKRGVMGITLKSQSVIDVRFWCAADDERHCVRDVRDLADALLKQGIGT